MKSSLIPLYFTFLLIIQLLHNTPLSSTGNVHSQKVHNKTNYLQIPVTILYSIVLSYVQNYNQDNTKTGLVSSRCCHNDNRDGTHYHKICRCMEDCRQVHNQSDQRKSKSHHMPCTWLCLPVSRTLAEEGQRS